MNVFLDRDKILNKDKNLYLGNKLLHIFFAINVSLKWNIKLILPKNSCFEKLFIIKKKYFLKRYKQPKLFYSEFSAFEIYRSPNLFTFYINLIKSYFLSDKNNLNKIFNNSKKQYFQNSNFLEKKIYKSNFFIKGNFWHFNLMPSEKELKKFFHVKKSLIKKIKKLYPNISSRNIVIVHLRGGDYKNHLKNYFKKNILLDRSYYLRAIKFFKKKFGNEVKFYFLTNDVELLSKYLTGIKIKKEIISSNDPFFDWTCLMLAKNIIQSNSSFCWTASLFNKINSTQPKNGYAYNYNIGPIPYGFYIKNSKII